MVMKTLPKLFAAVRYRRRREQDARALNRPRRHNELFGRDLEAAPTVIQQASVCDSALAGAQFGYIGVRKKMDARVGQALPADRLCQIAAGKGSPLGKAQPQIVRKRRWPFPQRL